MSDFLTVTPMEGTGDSNLSLAFSPNMQSTTRRVTVRAKINDEVYDELTLVQRAAPYMEIDPYEFTTLKTDVNEYRATVLTNTMWTASTEYDWITILNGRGDGNGTVIFKVSPNLSYERYGGITVTSREGMQKEIEVFQEQGFGNITVNPQSVEISADATVVNITVTSDVRFRVVTASGVTADRQYGAAGTRNVALAISANTGLTERTLGVLFYDDEAGAITPSATFLITQAGVVPSYITVNPSTLSFDEEGGSTSIQVSSNVTWVVSVNGEGSEYFTVFPTDGQGSALVNVSAMALAADDERNVTIDFFDVRDMQHPLASVSVEQEKEGFVPYIKFSPAEQMSENDTYTVSVIDKGYYPFLYWSRDGINWIDQFTTYGFTGMTATASEPNIYVRGDYRPDASGGHNFGRFAINSGLTSGVKVKCSGDIMSLYSYRYHQAELPYDPDSNGCFERMFAGNKDLVSAPMLSATVLSAYGYMNMFAGCSSLLKAPKIPATYIPNYCCSDMFSGCTSLTYTPDLSATSIGTGGCYGMFDGCSSLLKAPKIPATTLYYRSCYLMFRGCTSLETAYVLPATTLSEECYQSMFLGCTSLVNAPELSATTLAINCCNNMFQGCTSLVNAPVLPAKTLASRCYRAMFSGCTNLSYVKCLATSGTTSSTTNWLSGVSPTGTFVKNVDAPDDLWPTGASGIPSGWTVQTAAE